MIFDATGQAEVTFMGKEAQKLLGLEPSEFYQKQNEVIVILTILNYCHIYIMRNNTCCQSYSSRRRSQIFLGSVYAMLFCF